MSLRVGYVNVRGLDRETWKACQHLLHTRFDFLFLAETWFCNHAEYQADRRFIASTPRGDRKSEEGRDHGGIYLLGTHLGQSRIRKVKITSYSITFTVEKHTISGVYFPPSSISTADVATALTSLRLSSVILGDINTRFRDEVWQSGEAGPRDRLEACTQFLTDQGFEYCRPAEPKIKFTTDHCFARYGEKLCLELLPIQGFRTDHRYTLSITFTPPTCQLATDIMRFPIGKLSQPKVQKQLQERFRQCPYPFSARDTVEEMHQKLVGLCQKILKQVIGICFSFEKHSRGGT